MKVTRLLKSLRNEPPARLLLYGYASYVFMTWIFLCLPLSWENGPVGFLDNLFIATSAMSTTGLSTVDPGSAYSFFGEFVLLCSFQLGGIGYMTLGSFVVLARRETISPFRESIGRTVFGLPTDFDMKEFLRDVIYFTIAVEAVGAIGLYNAFKVADVPRPLWQAIFHSVSAFCTAGFSLFPNSLENFRGDFFVNLIISVECVLGAAGFLVMSDVWADLTDPRRCLTVTSRIIVRTMAICLLAGWVIFFFMEPSVRSLGLWERTTASWFQSMTAVTTVGFDTYAIGNFHQAALLVFLVLMFIGAAPAGTGGGLKATSVSVAFGVMRAVLRGRKQVTFWDRQIPDYRIYQAFASIGFYLIVYLAGCMVLLAVESHSFADLLFEGASALGTVGLSRGITATLTDAGKWVVTAMMFLGRLGPLAFGLAIMSGLARSKKKPGNVWEEDIVL